MMDRHALAILIPVIAVFFTGVIAFSRTRLGQALANRLEGRLDPSTDARLAALEAANDELQRALADAHERIDFAERALTRGSANRVITPI